MMNQIKGILVFYIDVGQLPPFKAEAFIERIQDRQKKLLTLLEEQGYETLWIPVRPNCQTKIEMIPLVNDCIPVISHCLEETMLKNFEKI